MNIGNFTDYNLQVLGSFNDFSLCQMVEIFVEIFAVK